MSIKYAQPELRNFGQDYRGRTRFLTKLDEWRAKHTGLFVMCALDEVIRVYALSDAKSHGQVCGECETQGRVLGGGSISLDDKMRPVSLSSRSMDFGSLPNNVLEEYFESFGYTVKAGMFDEGETKGIQDSTREYFKKHGIEI